MRSIRSRLLNGVVASGSRFTALSSDCLPSSLVFGHSMTGRLLWDDREGLK
jgi:hypothetical protein